MQHAIHEKTVQEIYTKLEAEIQARKALEGTVHQSKESVEKKYKEYEAQIDTVSCNFQMAITGKVAAESKNATLSEQKKILVKEVKSLRKRCDDYQSSVDSLTELNKKLLKVTQGLQQQQEILQFQVLQLQQQLDIANAKFKAAAEEEANALIAAPSDVPETSEEADTDKAQEEHEQSVEKAPASLEKDPSLEKANIDELVQYGEKLLSSLPSAGETDSTKGGDPAYPNSSSRDVGDNGTADRSIHSSDEIRAGTPVNISRVNGVNEEGEGQLSRKSTNSGEGEGDERSSWDLPSPALRDLSWLSEEQSKIVQKRLDENASFFASSANSTANGAPLDGYSVGHDQGSMNGQSNAASVTFAAATQTASSLFSGVSKAVLGNTNATGTPSAERRGSYFSIFTKGHEEDSGKQSTSTPAVIVPSTPEQPKAKTQQPIEEEGSGGVIMHCLRCNGTVRGPRLSTCKCSVPALTQDDLHSGSAMLSGFISKGSSVAGGLAGGFMKGVGGFMSTASNPTNTPISTPSMNTTSATASASASVTATPTSTSSTNSITNSITNTTIPATPPHTPSHAAAPNTGNAAANSSPPDDTVAL